MLPGVIAVFFNQNATNSATENHWVGPFLRNQKSDEETAGDTCFLHRNLLPGVLFSGREAGSRCRLEPCDRFYCGSIDVQTPHLKTE